MQTKLTLSNVLVRLADAAEAVINRPSMPNCGDLAQLDVLYDEVEEAVRLPREGVSHVGDHEIMLADVLLKIMRARHGDDPRVALWCQVGGVLLPVVREDAYRVMLAERAARPSTSDHDFQGGGRK